jgi:hypothetical protein
MRKTGVKKYKPFFCHWVKACNHNERKRWPERAIPQKKPFVAAS